MEYSVKKEPFCTSEVVFERSIEQPVDLEFSLPDYCPDIQKILKCLICPQINSRNISGDKLYIEGNTNISLIYLDEENSSIKYCEHSSPFSASLNLKDNVQDAIITTKNKIEYVNCRVVTPRRLDIHGAFSIYTKIKSKKEKDIVYDINGDGIEKKKNSANYVNLIGMGQQCFSISETIDNGNTQPNVEYILKSSINIENQEYKSLDNKIMVNAQLNIKILYISDIEYGTVETLEHNIPISQIVDIEGAQDECVCDIDIEVLNHSIKINNNSDNTLLDFDCKLCISVIAYEKKNTDVLTDVYSIDYELEPKYENVSLINLDNIINEQYTVKDNINIKDDNISEIIDINCDLANVKAFIDNEKIKFEGKINVCILAKNIESIPFYLERFIEFEYNYNLENFTDPILCEENVFIKSCNYKIIDQNNIDITLNLQINTPIYRENNYTSIVDIFIDEDNPKPKDKKNTLILYYPDGEEEIWNIARKYGTSVEKIKQENDIEGDIIQGKNMIFISK